MNLYIVVNGVSQPVLFSSLAEGTASFLRGMPPSPEKIGCDGCGEDLTDGPCRLGRVECYWCGRHYPMIVEEATIVVDSLDQEKSTVTATDALALAISPVGIA